MRLSTSFAIAVLLLCRPTAAQDATSSSVPLTRPKVGLVLSGGGARGAAHIGVLKVLDEMRVPVDFIAGTSMGALVGASYASGTGNAELERRLTTANWNDLLTDSSPREDRSFLRKEEDQARLLKLEIGVQGLSLRLPPGAISGQKLDALFSSLTRFAPGNVDFDQLPIPFRAIATDAETGRMVVLDRGRLPDAMRASMSVPGAVAPFEINNRIYLDGGLTRNLPVDIVRRMGADVVIAVNIGSGLLKRDELRSVVGISLQMINILTEQNVVASLEELKRSGGILIAPDLGDIGSGDFDRSLDAVRIGEASARAAAAHLKPLALSEADYVRHQAARIARMGRPVHETDTIDAVRVVGLERASEDELKRALDVKPGDTVNFKKIDGGISRAFGSGYFERINYSLLNESDRQVLVVNAREKPWGPHYLRLGLSLAADTAGEGRFNLLIRSEQTQFNAAGAEWRNDVQIGRDRRFASRFIQPFGSGSIVNVSPGIEFVRRPIDIYLDGKRTVQYDVTATDYLVDFGMDIGRNAIARIGLMRGTQNADLNIGLPSLPNFDVKQGGARFRAVYDNLDDINFPRAGRSASLEYTASLTRLGASGNYRKWETQYIDHLSIGRHTFALGLRAGGSEGGRLPVFDQFSLGGFLQLSGYRPGELLGDRVALARLGYYQHLPLNTGLLGSRLFAGISLEAGRVGAPLQTAAPTDIRKSLGLFLGADTALGPLYVGYGRARDRGTVFYFFLGQP